MKKPGILKGIAVAAVLTALGFSLAIALSLILMPWFIPKLILGTLAYLYILYLIVVSGAKAGKVTLGAGSGLVLLGGLACGLSLPFFILLAVGLIWLIRALYNYSSLVLAGVDAGLCLLGLSLALGAATYTGQPLMGVWVFFLTQALFGILPVSMQEVGSAALGRAKGSASEDQAGDDGRQFGAAYRRAEESLQKIAVQLTAGKSV